MNRAVQACVRFRGQAREPAWREHPRRSDAPSVETVDVERPLRRLARFRGLISEARPTMAGISFSVKGTFPFSSANSTVWRTIVQVPNGRAHCSYWALTGYPHVEEWWRGSGFLPRFPELVSQESLGGLEFSTGCPHRALCFLELRSSASALGFPGEGSRKIVRESSESKGNDEPCAHLSHSHEIVELFRV